MLEFIPRIPFLKNDWRPDPRGTYPPTGEPPAPAPPKPTPPAPESVQRLEAELAANQQRRAAIAQELPTLEAAYSGAALGWDVSQLVEERLKMNAAADRMRQLRREAADLEADEPLLRRRLEAVRKAEREAEHVADLERLDRLVAEAEPMAANFRALVVEAVEVGGELRERVAAIKQLYSRCRAYAEHNAAAEAPSNAYKAVAVPVVQAAWFTDPRGPEWARRELLGDD